MDKILDVKNLRVSFRTSGGTVKAVRDISFELERGKTLAIVGESGSGKSVTSKAILGILAGNSIIESGEILYDGKDLLKISEEEMCDIRGNRISIDIDGVINVFEKMDYPGDYNVISGMDDAPQGMVHGVGIHCETLDEAAALTAELNEKFGASLNAFQNVIEVDIAPKGCSKGAGVQAVRDYFGECKVYGIGDSLNDLPLLLASDVSYTFPYAPAELQEKVTKVVPTIVEALEDSMQDPL